MFERNNHVIHLVDGRLGHRSASSSEDVARIVHRAIHAGSTSGIAIHFHGGLVGEAKAMQSIEQRLFDLYAERAGAYPVFFVWESGFFEAPLNNLQEIAAEDLFQEFAKKAAEWVLKKLPGGSGLRGTGAASIDESRLRAEFDAWFAGKRPQPPLQLCRLPSAAALTAGSRDKGAAIDELGLAEEIAESIDGDRDFQDAVTHVYNGLQKGGRLSPATRGIGVRASAASLISKEAASRLFAEEPKATKGFSPIAWIKVARVLAAIVIRVVRRVSIGRAHGAYVTLVEEILRELYVDKLGRYGWWERMKTDTADAFRDGDEYGGTVFLKALRAEVAHLATPPRLTLVGHSTGAIYICNLLKAAAQHVPDLRFDVIFEAPAATHAQVAATVAEHGSRIRDFRQFGMGDEWEAADALVPILYPSSLLYFVSGLLEAEVDEPLVGMARYLEQTEVYNAAAFPNVEACRRFYAQFPNSLVWSPSASAVGGLASNCRHHGDFDDVDPITMSSVQYILQHGY